MIIKQLPSYVIQCYTLILPALLASLLCYSYFRLVGFFLPTTRLTFQLYDDEELAVSGYVYSSGHSSGTFTALFCLPITNDKKIGSSKSPTVLSLYHRRYVFLVPAVSIYKTHNLLCSKLTWQQMYLPLKMVDSKCHISSSKGTHTHTSKTSWWLRFQPI